MAVTTLLFAEFLEGRLDCRPGLEIRTLDFHIGRDHEHSSVGESELGAAHFRDLAFNHLATLRGRRLRRGGCGALGERISGPCYGTREGKSGGEPKSNAPHPD